MITISNNKYKINIKYKLNVFTFHKFTHKKRIYII